MMNIGNDGSKHPSPDPDENKVVNFLPTLHQYKIGHLPDSELVRDNTEQLLMELGVMGADGWLLVSLLPTPGETGMHTAIFARTGVKTEKPKEHSKLHIPGKPKGLL